MDGKLSGMAKIAVLALVTLGLAGCQFQPLYSSNSGTTGLSSVALSQVAVSEVDTREAQQVRNHLIFLLSGGANPLDPSHDVKLRVSSSTTNLAGAIQSRTSSQIGNTAGSVQVTASYEIFDRTRNEIIARGTRQASAAFDQTSQSFANQRAERDAENRAAKALAEQLRLAIASDFNKI